MTERLVRVLETFTPTRTAQSVSEISRRADLPVSSGHRIVAELVAAGLLERGADRKIRVGLRLWELATRSSSMVTLRQAAHPYMERVQLRLRQHTQLVVLDDDEALCIERLSAPESGENLNRVAGRLPLHACSAGLVLLAFGDAELQSRVLGRTLRRLSPETITDPKSVSAILGEVRRRGYAIAPGYVSPVSTGVAVPVRSRPGTVIAALSVVLPRESSPEPAVLELRSAARGLAAAISRLPSDSTQAGSRLP